MFRTAFVLMSLLPALIRPASCQTITGTILGTVTDSSGAALPGASVEALHLETNQALKVKTSDLGIYEVPYLRPGNYRVTVTREGFRRAGRDEVELRVEDRLRLDFRMEVGDPGTSVHVTGEAPLIESENASLGEVISNKALEELPTMGRNIFDLVGLAAGVQVNPRAEGGTASTGSNGAPLFVQSDISINGGRYRTNEFLVDGISIMLPENNNFAFSPTPNGTQEFKVMTNSFGPQYGRSGGGVVNVVTRGGSNDFHGALYEFFRNERMKANNFFNNARNLGRGSFHFNQFGAALGGRLIRDRTFFFAEYQGHRELVGGGSGILTVPTAVEKSGDFSKRVNATGQPVTIYDSTVGSTNEQGVYTRSPFPGNIIPASRQSPLARNLMQYLPLPNRAGEGPALINNFVWSRRNWLNSDQWNVRIDHRFSGRFSLFGRITHNNGNSGNNGPYNSIADNVLGLGENRVWNAMINTNWVVTPRWLVNVRFGATRRFEGRVPLSAGQVDLTKLGFASNIAAAVEEEIFPAINIQNFASLGPASGDRIRRGNQVYTLVFDETLIRGRHTFTWGLDTRLYDQTPFQAGASSGTYSFSPSETRGPNPLSPSLTSGEALASYLMGFGSGSVSKSPALAIRNMYYGLYLNDDIKLGRLTVNAGVRWEHERPRTERYNRFGFFDFDAPFPIQPAGVSGLKGMLRYSGQDGYPRGQTDTYYRNFGPRVGLAYRVTPSFVVRAGYGIFFAPRFGTTGGNNYGTPGYTVSTTWVSSLDNLVLLNPFDNPFPNGLLERPGDLADRVQLGQSLLMSDWHNKKSPYNQQWNLSLQRQFPRSMLVEAVYTGNKGTRLPVSLNANQVDPKYQSLGAGLNRTVSNVFYGLVGSGTLSTRTVATLQTLRPYPQYVSVSTNSPALALNIGDSSYHAMQLRVQKRMALGAFISLAYTVSKLIDNGSGRVFGENAFVPPVQNSYNLRGERAISEGDVSQRLALSHTLDVPFGKGKKWLNGPGRATNLLAANWTLTGTMSAQTGFPLALSSIGNSGVSGAVLRPNSTGKSAGLEGPTQQRLTRYFDITQFTVPDTYTFGNVTRTLPDVRGPGRIAWNLALQKSIRLWERKMLAFRADSFNLTNTPYFIRPGQNLGSTNFGVIDTATGERIIQLGLKLTF